VKDKLGHWRNSAHVLFPVVLLIFGVIFINITPPLWGLDEPSHFARVFHILKGDFVSTESERDPANAMPDNFIELYEYRVADILDTPNRGTVVGSVLNRQDVTELNIYERLTNRPFSESAHFFPSIANYSPLAYIGPTAGVMFANLLDFDIGATLTFARVFGLISYAVMGVLALWLVRNLRLRWLFFVGALLPTAVFQASMITADTALFGGVLIFLALFVRAVTDEKPSCRILIGLALLAAMLPLLKANFVLLSFIVAFVPLKGLASRRMSIIYRTSVIVIPVLVAIGWSLLSRVSATPAYSQRADQQPISPGDQIAFALEHPLAVGTAWARSLLHFGDAYYSGVFVTISGNDVPVPLAVVVLLSILTLLAALYGRSLHERKDRVVLIPLAVACVLVVVSTFGALYAGFSPVGYSIIDGVQGRYFTPLVVPLAILIGGLLPVRVTSRAGALPSVLTGGMIASLAVSVIYVWIADY